jgi:hypothetical protein
MRYNARPVTQIRARPIAELRAPRGAPALLKWKFDCAFFTAEMSILIDRVEARTGHWTIGTIGHWTIADYRDERRERERETMRKTAEPKVAANSQMRKRTRTSGDGWYDNTRYDCDTIAILCGRCRKEQRDLNKFESLSRRQWLRKRVIAQEAIYKLLSADM